MACVSQDVLLTLLLTIQKCLSMIALKSEKQELLARLIASGDEALYRGLFPELFTLPFSGLHRQIIETINGPHNKKLILAPRGLGKTSIARGLCMKEILLRNVSFIVYISNSLAVAEQQTENLKRELMSNELLQRFGFGAVKPTAVEGSAQTDSFSKQSWVAYNRTLILPRGCGQQIRGLNWRNFRPDLIILDDPEKKDELHNETIRGATRSWFMSDVRQCVDRLRGWRIFYFDTLKHCDALPVHLMNQKDWDYVKLSACDREYNSLAPEFIKDEDIQEALEECRLTGTMDDFAREFMNEPTSTETASFKREHFRHYVEADLSHEDVESFQTVVIMDPAKTVSNTSDKTALVGVSFQPSKRRRYVRDVVNGRLHHGEIYQATVDMALRLNATAIAIEVTSLNEHIIGPFRDFLIREGFDRFEIIELKARGKKEARIIQLMPAYRAGLIYHNEACCQELERQLLSFPSSQFDDIMDALAYSEQISELAGLYNEPEYDEYEKYRNQEDGIDYTRRDTDLDYSEWEMAI